MNKDKKVAFILIVHISITAFTALYGMDVAWRWLGYKTYTPEESKIIEQIKQLELLDNDRIEKDIADFSVKEINTFLDTMTNHNLTSSYPKVFNELSAQQLIKGGQKEELFAEQIEELNKSAIHKEITAIKDLPQKTKDKVIAYIEQFRKKHNHQMAYQELYEILKPQLPIKSAFDTTEMTAIKTIGYPEIITNIININQIELNGPRCSKKVLLRMPIETIIAIHGDLPDNLEDLTEEHNIETVCNEITQKQQYNECGLMSIYNAQQLYLYLTNKLSKANFEKALKSFNLNTWEKEVEQCPIDLSDIVTLMQKHMPLLPNQQYTIIPTLVDDNNRLSYIPLKKTTVLTNADGTISSTFNQDESLLNAIKNIHDPSVDEYIHVFYLNNLQPSVHGASMRHWIPIVLHKKHNQLYVYIIDSANVYHEDIKNQNEHIVDISRLEKMVTKDNLWAKALIQLLAIDPHALQLGLDTVKKLIKKDDYSHDYTQDILDTLEQNHSSEASNVRALLLNK